MDETYPHLRLRREERVTQKRSGRPPRFPPRDDPAAHGRILRQSLEKAKAEADSDIGGFDDRRLFRFSVIKGFDPDALEKLAPGIEVVSQEGEECVVAFVNEAALASFEARLSSLVRNEHVTYKQFLCALDAVNGWKAEDRISWALKNEGFPEQSPFMLDVELWPLENFYEERLVLWKNFQAWLEKCGISCFDSVKQPHLTLFRVRCDRSQAEMLLHHRDVRTVDLPPKFGLSVHILSTDIQNILPVQKPPENAPGITILDSGLTAGHPLLAPAVGDVQSFIPGKDAVDQCGHGTHVAGIALYGDFEQAVLRNEFTPEFRLFSGRILDERNENSTGFVENQIAEAVEYFLGQYGCKIFNLSFGDANKPYFGGHVRGLGTTLDTLARDLDVLFVVSAGNVVANMLDGLEWKNGYPDYLTEKRWSILDPASALNVLTVGSMARYDATLNSQRYTFDPGEVPVARSDQPSPFTRSGPSVGGAIKPELVAYGGNFAINSRANANVMVSNCGLGELSTCFDFANGRLLAAQCGTSMAAPHVTHLAACIQTEYPHASSCLIRALLVAHAAVPTPCSQLLSDQYSLRRVCGYGCVDQRALVRSMQNDTSMFIEESIGNKMHHFYEIPIPDDFVSRGRRVRELSVGLAYSPHVRSTRITYRTTRIEFKVVVAPDFDYVSKMFDKATKKEDYDNIKELSRPDVSSMLRKKGTVQAATWRMKQFNARSCLCNNRLFVVVTRN
ncbi:MAG: S8 family peptidase, partial [Desulfoplanes sp.]|nr:S8 family peptidase [Desulfoplanes sp.]